MPKIKKSESRNGVSGWTVEAKPSLFLPNVPNLRNVKEKMLMGKGVE